MESQQYLRLVSLAQMPLPFGKDGRLPSLDKGVLTSSHICRWCAAQQNWDKIHYDQRFAKEEAKLPDIVINGALKQQFMVQFVNKAFGYSGWLWQLTCRFIKMDLVGHNLVVEGEVVEFYVEERHIYFVIDLRILNTHFGEVTTCGEAIVAVDRNGGRMVDGLGLSGPKELAINLGEDATSDLPQQIRDLIGKDLESVRAFVPVDGSRLVLFAEAIMDLDPVYYDAEFANLSQFGHVVAPPLFPLHAVKSRPGVQRLREEASASGREGVCEVGRSLADILGVGARGMVNGGGEWEIRSLANIGEYVAARSRLLAAKIRKNQLGEKMLIVATGNKYFVVGTERELVRERQTLIYRDI